mmetsp:Transcript_40509/g.87482  ORF Transcript_40509/g.87482 Transcript_40509/m.87482 type:complete len:152 (+) Transcript_40509:658-1113(+)
MESLDDDTQNSAVVALPPPPLSRVGDTRNGSNTDDNPTSTVTRREIQRIIKNVLATTGIIARGHIVRARRKRLTFVTSCIERQLYNAASTYDDYANLDTLYKRMSRVLTALIIHEQQQSQNSNNRNSNGAPSNGATTNGGAGERFAVRSSS